MHKGIPHLQAVRLSAGSSDSDSKKNNTPAGSRSFFFRMSAAEFSPRAEQNLAFGLEPHRRYSESDHM